jgi:acetyl esterase/lipase
MKKDCRSRHLVEREALEFLEKGQRPALTRENLRDIREYARSLFNTAHVHSGTVKVEKMIIPGLSGEPDVPITLFLPDGRHSKLAAVLHIHGGGYVAGSVEAAAGWSEWLVTNLGCVVAAPDYRLAPETPHPSGLRDCYATLAWLYQNAAAWSVDQRRIALFGGSAGGGFAAAVALMARDRKQYPVCFQCLLYPMLDDRTGVIGESNPYAGEYAWTYADNTFGWHCLLGHEPGQPVLSPYAVPARSEDLSNLPPTYIWVGALDLLVDEALTYAQRLIYAGVPTELHVYPGVTHGNIVLAEAPSSKVCRATTLSALKRGIGTREHLV